MAQNGFPKPVEDVLATLLGIYHHQGRQDLIDLLENSFGRFEEVSYDRWDGGTYTYDFFLEVPVPIFSASQPKLEELERTLSTDLTLVCRDLTHDHIGSVIVLPLSADATGSGRRLRPSNAAVRGLWHEGFLRLFLSHAAKGKTVAGSLKQELTLLGVSAFIAHQSIRPSVDWQNRIELALRSMHALAALLTLDFHKSSWTDQEIGYAMGGGVPVVPVRLGKKSYGFLARFQELAGSPEQPRKIAEEIVSTLLEIPSTGREMRKGIASAFAAADSAETVTRLGGIILTTGEFTDEEKATMREACKDNSQISGLSEMVTRICTAIGVTNPNEPFELEDDIPF